MLSLLLLGVFDFSG